MKKKRLKITALLAAVVMIMTLIPSPAAAAVKYHEDVTAEMSKASYWSDKMKEPEKVLASEDSLDEIQQSIYSAGGMNMTDLSKWTRETFNGVTTGKDLMNGAFKEAKDAYSPTYWCRYDDKGNYIASEEEALKGYYKPMIDNCKDETATESMPVRFAICTKRTCITIFPSDKPLHDDPADPDYDFRFLSVVRVNEPVVLMAKSNDGKYYQATSSCVSGWIPKEDVAICESKEAWLKAWNFDKNKTLVVYDDKIRTEDSNFNPAAANRLLPMGTCLELADESEWTDLISNRAAYNNHVVWMPVRKTDGTYERQLALIGENKKVSEGFLPVTSENIAMVALNWLGDAYGWGGMLSANDCSGYVRDVYKCFGLDLARNTSWQALQPVKKYDLRGKSNQKKAEIIKKLPVGAVLIFDGHEMIYLGDDGDKLYVISSVSNMAKDGVKYRVRDTLINTLDVQRKSKATWLESLETANVPYLDVDGELPERKTEPKPEPVPQLPAPKLSIKANSGKKSVEMSWNEIENAGGYLVSYRKSDAASWTVKNTNKVDYTVKGLNESGIYQFRVAAKPGSDKMRQSKYSDTLNAYISKMKCKLNAGKRSLKVTWKKDKSASGYYIRYSVKKSMKGAKTITIKKAGVQSYKIKKLKKKKRYYVQIRAFKKYGGKVYKGEFSDKVSKKTK